MQDLKKLLKKGRSAFKSRSCVRRGSGHGRGGICCVRHGFQQARASRRWRTRRALSSALLSATGASAAHSPPALCTVHALHRQSWPPGRSNMPYPTLVLCKECCS